MSRVIPQTLRAMLFPTLLLGSLLTTSVSVQAAESLSALQQQWAVCSYKVEKGDSREKCLKDLVATTEQALKVAPERDDIRVWLAITESSLAGEKGGLGALSLVKKAKKELEKVISHDGSILDGSAYTTLGSLYYQVPGWPIGFGDDDEAEKLLKKALAMNPDGIDSNYFYADFLADQGYKVRAAQYFQKALTAPPRVGRELADQGRRDQIKEKLKALHD